MPGEPLPPFLRRDSFVEVEAGSSPARTTRYTRDAPGSKTSPAAVGRLRRCGAGGRGCRWPGVALRDTARPLSAHRQTGGDRHPRRSPPDRFRWRPAPYLAWAAVEVPSCIRPRPPAPAGEPRTPPLPDRLHRPALGRGPGGVPVAPTGGARRGAGEKRKTAGVDRSHLSTALQDGHGSVVRRRHRPWCRVPEIPGGFPALPGGLLSGADCCQV